MALAYARTLVRFAAFFALILFSAACSNRSLRAGRNAINNGAAFNDTYSYQPNGNSTVGNNTPVNTPPPQTSCTLTSILPAPGQKLQAGAVGKLLLTVNTNVAIRSLIFKDELKSDGEARVIDPPGSRQILIRPTQLTSYIAKWRTDHGENTCRVSVDVEAGQFYNGGQIVIVTGSFPSTPPPPEPVPTYNVRMQPICSVARRVEPKQVYQSIVAKSAPVTISIEAVTATGRKEVLFARRLPMDSALLSGGFDQPVPIELMSYATGNIEIRACHDKNNNFACSDESANDNIMTGKKPAGNNSTYLTESVYITPGNTVANTVIIETWNRRGARNGSADPTCMAQYSPLVLDLKGDGILTSSAENSGVVFDLEAVGQEVRTGWVQGVDDAFLVRDINRDGYINSGAELFGSSTRLSSGELAANGFLALRDLDSNGDGKFTASDAKYSEVKVWLAHDFRRVSESAKPTLYPLHAVPVGGETLRIQEIDLSYVEVLEEQNGNFTRQQSNFFLLKNGMYVPRLIADIWFKVLPF